MKKSMLIGMAAVAMLAGCNRAEIVEQNPENAISFGTSFVDNMTKVTENEDFSNRNLPASQVYGVMQLAEGQLVTAFNGVNVNTDGSYSPVQYWQKGADYWFEAFAPAANNAWSFTMNEKNQMDASRGTLAFNNETAQGKVDLLAAVPDKITDVKPSTQQKVALNFQHQLSRVKVRFVNENISSAYYLKFSKVKITNAVKSANMDIQSDIAGQGWKDIVKGNFAYVLDMPQNNPYLNSADTTSVMTDHIYMIPQADAFNVCFTIEMFQRDEDGTYRENTYNHVVPTAQIPAMAKGNSYILTARINESNIVPPVNPDDPDQPVDPDDLIHYIEFTVDVDAWGAWNDVHAIDVPDTPHN